MIYIICLCVLLSACSVVNITDNNRATVKIDNDASMSELFNSWTPLKFKSGQTFNYDFVISTDKYTVNGIFALSVRGIAPAGLNFSWKFTIGNDEKKGSYFGSSKKFLNKLEKFCSDNVLYSTVYAALFVPYKDMDQFSTLVSQNQQLHIGDSWPVSVLGEGYTAKLESVDNHGGIDGFTMTTLLNDVPEQIICVSPYTVLPILSAYFIENESENTKTEIQVVCELSGAIL